MATGQVPLAVIASVVVLNLIDTEALTDEMNALSDADGMKGNALIRQSLDPIRGSDALAAPPSECSHDPPVRDAPARRALKVNRSDY
jgi:hypothetical protein